MVAARTGRRDIPLAGIWPQSLAFTRYGREETPWRRPQGRPQIRLFAYRPCVFSQPRAFLKRPDASAVHPLSRSLENNTWSHATFRSDMTRHVPGFRFPWAAMRSLFMGYQGDIPSSVERERMARILYIHI